MGRRAGDDRCLVLAGMLLHVVKAASPINPADGPLALQRRRQQVGYPVSFIHDIGHSDSAGLAGVGRLAAGSWSMTSASKSHR